MGFPGTWTPLANAPAPLPPPCLRHRRAFAHSFRPWSFGSSRHRPIVFHPTPLQGQSGGDWIRRGFFRGANLQKTQAYAGDGFTFFLYRSLRFTPEPYDCTSPSPWPWWSWHFFSFCPWAAPCPTTRCQGLPTRCDRGLGRGRCEGETGLQLWGLSPSVPRSTIQGWIRGLLTSSLVCCPWGYSERGVGSSLETTPCQVLRGYCTGGETSVPAGLGLQAERGRWEG